MQAWNSTDSDDWDRAFRDYFDPLLKKHPDDSHGPEIDELRGQLEERKALQRAEETAKRTPVPGEAQWFYQEGLRLRQGGNEDAARRLFENVATAFAGVKSEQPWVELANRELRAPSELSHSADKRWKPAREALARARELRDQGKRKQAEEIWDGLRELYENDKSATPILDEVKRDRGG